MSPSALLRAGIAGLGLNLPADAETRLLAYLELLAKWNRTFNLTAVRTPADMVCLHLLDSLAVLPVIEKSAPAARRFCDIGSGAGLPAIPLAVARPDWSLLSVDAVSKKAAFQRQARIELGLANLEIRQVRAENLPGGGHDAVISRAFGDLRLFVSLAGRLIEPGGCLLAMKGALPAAEIDVLPPGWRAEAQRLHVPGLDAERHLVVLTRVA